MAIHWSNNTTIYNIAIYATIPYQCTGQHGTPGASFLICPVKGEDQHDKYFFSLVYKHLIDLYKYFLTLEVLHLTLTVDL